MRKLFAIAITGSLFLLACNKPDFHAPAAVTTSPEPASSVLATSPTTVLTAHPWMYQGFYLHYIDQQHKGDPQYIRSGSYNIINLDATRITYKTDGTFMERDGVNTFPGTWQFTNAADSVLVMNYSYGTDVYTVVTLNSTHLNYTKLIPISYRHNNLTYSELVPAQ